MADILDLTQYKTYKGITTTEYDGQLSAYIDSTNKFIEEYCNREFGPGEYSEQREGIVNHLSAYVFNVQNKPIVSVQSVALKFIGTTEELSVDTTRLDIFKKAGYMYYSHQLTPATTVLRPEYRENFYYTITYSGGEAVPSPVKLAAVTMVSDTFEYFNRTNTALASGTQQVGELKSVKIGDYSESYATGDSLYRSMHGTRSGSEGGGFVLTQTVKDLLTPYRAQGQSW
jgi:Phage gp6-like head-tail connector protein